MTANLVVFLQAVAATAGWINGVFFLKFWKETGDRLFLLFGLAFWLLSTSWAVLALWSPTEENRPYVYGLRLLAFGLIIAAIVQKNRRAS
jgi:hypothetical protein